MKQELTLWYEIFSELFMRILELEKTASCNFCIIDTATMQCPRRGPALSMHIVNFSSKRAPILCKHTCIR